MIKLTSHQEKQYKAMTDRINSFGDNPPEELLNGRHNFMNAILINQFNTKKNKL